MHAEPVTMTKDQEPVPAAGGRRCVSFALSQERFALAVEHIREVLPVPELTPVPDSPSSCLGLVNLRGRIVTVMDLRQLLQIGHAAGSGAGTHLLVTELDKELIALLVDGIGEVTTLYPERVETGKAAALKQPYGLGVAHDAGQFIVVLDLEALLGSGHVH